MMIREITCYLLFFLNYVQKIYAHLYHSFLIILYYQMCNIYRNFSYINTISSPQNTLFSMIPKRMLYIIMWQHINRYSPFLSIAKNGYAHLGHTIHFPTIRCTQKQLCFLSCYVILWFLYQIRISMDESMKYEWRR